MEEDEEWRPPLLEELAPLPGQVAPFAATSDESIKALLEIAEVKPTDVILDLGCGDGRILIEASRRFGIKGRGVEINPSLLEKARRMAHDKGVTHLVEFQEISFLDEAFELSPATIIVLYLLPECLSVLLEKIRKYVETSKVSIQVLTVHFNFDRLLAKKVGGQRNNVYLYTNEEILQT